MPFDDQPHLQLATMSRWYVVSRAIHAVAQLGLANHMSEPATAADLAKVTSSDPVLLDRLLKFLSAYKIFDYQDGQFALTELSKPLRDDDPHSIRDVLCMVDESWWQAFSQLENSLKSGTPAFELQHGNDFFSFLSEDKQKQANFDNGMAKLSTYDDIAIAKAFDFSCFKTIVDLGAGRGGLSNKIAELNPNSEVILFDSHAVIQQLKTNEFCPNVSTVEGNFFEKIPQGDAYIFKGVLHDFNDEMMHDILRNCAQQMPPNSPLFIVEQVMPDHDQPHPNKTMDIVMMVLLGGRQRHLHEWQHCIEASGFVFKDSYKTASLFTLMEFRLEGFKGIS